MLTTSLSKTYTTPNEEKLEFLKAFAQKKILYNDLISVDSVIGWSEQLLPAMKRSAKDREMYFLLQLQLANAYTLRGDISLAIDQARIMYEEAKEMDYKFGLVVANQAIGDAYTIANQCDKALDSYQDALKELDLISPQHPYRTQLLLKTSNTLQRKGRLKEAWKALEEIKKHCWKSRIMQPVSLLSSKKLIMPFPTGTFRKLISKKLPTICKAWTPFIVCIRRSFIISI